MDIELGSVWGKHAMDIVRASRPRLNVVPTSHVIKKYPFEFGPYFKMKSIIFSEL